MRLCRLWLSDFRNYPTAELSPGPGLTAVLGANGEGKTNLLEAVGYLAGLRSFRGAATETLVRSGAEIGVVRAETTRAGRQSLIELELRVAGRDRSLLNRQPVRRSRELLEVFQTTVFAPDDLALVKGGPQLRRELLDDLLSALHPRHDAVRTEVERVLRQRGALLRQAGGNPRPPADVVTTLDVWDAKLDAAGTQLAAARQDLVERLTPAVRSAYEAIAGGPGHLVLGYAPSWQGRLLDALAAARTDDLRRGVSTVGPHRDELVVVLDGLPARTHASQGEQRSLALSIRLAGHRLLTEELGEPPVLLFDDVFSELDQQRSAALLRALPPGQAFLSTAGTLPAGATPDLVVRVSAGRLVA